MSTTCATSSGSRRGRRRRRIEKERPGTLREFKEVAERSFLVDKLREHNWNISKTAEVIGTPRSNSVQEAGAVRDLAGERRVGDK